MSPKVIVPSPTPEKAPYNRCGGSTVMLTVLNSHKRHDSVIGIYVALVIPHSVEAGFDVH